MDVNQKLTAEYKDKKYRRRRDGKVVIISHVLEGNIPNNGTYFEAIYDVVDPEPSEPGKGSCALDVLQTWRRIVSIRDLNAMSEHHFPFKIGEAVNIDEDSNTGIVEDAIWEGDAVHYTMSSSVKLANNEIREIGLANVLALNKEKERKILFNSAKKPKGPAL